MNEEALKQLYYNIGGEKAVGGSYEQWRDAIRDNNEAKQQLFNNIGGEKAVGGKYELWDSELFGGVKKKETSQPTSPLVLKSSEDAAQQSGILESEFVPSQSNAKVQPEKQPKKGIKDATEEEIKKTLISVGDYTQTKEQRLANIKERIDTEKDKLPTTIKEYLIDYGVKNLYDIGLDDNFNPDKKITRDEIYKFNNYLIQKNNRELKEREAEIDASKYKGVPAWLGMNYLRSLSTGINQGSANLFKRLDGALNMILDAGAMLTNQDDQLENLRKKGYETVFKRAADYIEENKVKPYQDLDPDALQTAVNALGQMNSFFMEMAVPITKTSGATEAILKMPAVMGFDGATETYSELTKSNTPIAEKIKESAVAGGKGAEAGMVFSLMGVGAKMLSQPIKNEYAQVLTEMALNSGGFGAYAGLTMGEKPDDMTDEEWESKRKKEIISNTILGGIMGAKHLPEQLLGASYARAMRTSADNIKKVMDMNIDSRKSEEILKNIVEIDKQLKELEDSPENQNKKIELQLAKDVQSNTLMLNLGAKTIQANPTYVKEKILQSEQSELDKQQQLQKVSEISNMSKQIQEADAVSEQIKTKQKEIGFVESDINNGLGDQITNNSKKTLLEKDIKDLEKQQQEILSRDKTEEILGTSEPRPTEQVTDKVNDIVKQEKPEPTKVNVFGKEMNTYNNFIPEKEQVESEALYSFTSNSKEGIPEILRDKAKLITKATTKINGKTVENETWTANITGEELNKLYEKQSKKADIERRRQEDPSVERGVLINYESGKTKEQLIDIVSKLKEGKITFDEIVKEFFNLPINTLSEVKQAFNDGTLADKIQFGLDANELSEGQSKTRSREQIIESRQKALSEKQKAETALKDSEYKIVKKKDPITGSVTETKVKRTAEEKAKYENFYKKELEDVNKRIKEYDAELANLEEQQPSQPIPQSQADGSNPELVKAVEEAIGKNKEPISEPTNKAEGVSSNSNEDNSASRDVESKKANIKRRIQEVENFVNQEFFADSELLSKHWKTKKDLFSNKVKQLKDLLQKGIKTGEDLRTLTNLLNDIRGILNEGININNKTAILTNEKNIQELADSLLSLISDNVIKEYIEVMNKAMESRVGSNAVEKMLVGYSDGSGYTIDGKNVEYFLSKETLDNAKNNKQINTKYDAELEALEKQQPPQGKGEGDWSAEQQRIENDKTLSAEQKEKAKIESTAKELRKIKDENYDNERIKKIEELTKEPTDEEIYLESQKNERLTEQDKNFSKYTYEKTKEKTKEEDIDMSKITPINTGIFGINSWETKDGVVKVERVNTGYGYSKHASIPNYYKIYYDGKLIAKTDSYITALKYTKDYLDGKEVPKEPNENGKIMLPSDKKSEYRVNKNIESDYIISEQYHKAKADGSNPELVKAVEELLSLKKDINATETKEVSPTQQKETKSETPSVVSETKSVEKPISEIKPSPAPVETGLAKSDIVKKYVEEIKTKEDISETKKTEATKKISDGLSEISEIIASKLQAKKGIVEDTDVNFRESLKKVAEGVYDLSVLKAEELIDKVKEVFKKTFEGEQLREVIKQINNNSEEIAALYYDKKGEKLKKTELQKQIDKAVGQTTKLNREYSKLKRDMLFLEKGDNATEAEKYNNFLFKVRDIVSDAKKEGEIDYDIADKILSEIEKTTKFKKELTRESKRIEALVKIENLITENVVSTQHEKLTKDIEKQIGQRLQKQGSKQKGYTIEEWDFKNNVDALLKTKTDLNKANTELEQKLSETTDPKEEANLMEKMMIVDYASRVKEYEDIILNFDKLSLNEKREAITKLTELKEYFKDKTKDFIEKYKEEVQQRAEHKQKLRETSEKGTRRKDYDSKVRLLENVLKNSESKEDILFELISNSDKSVSEKLNKKSQKLLALNDVDFRLELQKILGVKLESKSERDIEDTKSKIFVFHPLKALENLRGLTETVFGLGGKENYKPINEIMDRIDDSPRVMERLDVKMRNMIDNTVDVLDKKIKNIRNDKTSKLGISIKGKNGKEAPELYELSYTQVVSIALQMRQDLGYISAVKRYGEEGAMRLQNHVESIIKNTPTLKQYADSVLNFYKENYDAINEVYRKIYKTDMPNIDGYVPLTKISEILETIGMEVGVDGAANKRGTLYVSPSNLNKRKGGGELDISKDAEQVMNNYRKQMSDFVAYAEVKREMIELFTDPQVRANIKSISGGDTYLKYFDLYLNNFPNVQRTDTMVAERLVTSLIRNVVIAPLTLNPKLFFIQAASASNFSTEMVYDAAWKYLPVVNQSLYIKELLKANRWSEYIDQFKDSAFIKHRLQQGFDRDFQAFVNNRFIPTLKSNTNTKKIINELGRIIEKEIKTGAIKAGDIASFLGGMPVYYQQKEILRKENPTMPEDMLRLKAFEKMATLGEKSLQSSYVHLLSPYQLSRVSKLTPYMSNPIQFQQKQFRAIRNLSRGGGSAKEYAQSVNGLLFYSIGTTIIFEAIQAFYNNVILGKQYDDEDENPIQTDEQKKLTGKAIEWIGKGFMQGVPVAGESIEFIGLKLQKKKGFQPEASGTIARANDVLKTTLDITSFLADNYTSKDGFDWDKIPKSKRDKFFKDMRATLEYAGWNTKPTEKIIDRIKDGTAYPITLDIYKQAAINRYVKTGNPDMINDLRSKGIITKQVKKAMLKRALKLKEGKDYTDEELENEVKKEKKKELKEEKIKELKLKDND